MTAPFPPKSAYFFDHVPKSGGLALRMLFEELLPPTDFSPPADGLHADVACRRFAQYRFIGGHVGFRPGAPFDPNRFYFAVLREPVDRIVSLYYYFRHALSPDGDQCIEDAHRHDLDGFVSAAADRGDGNLINFQSIHFASVVSRDFGPKESLLGDLAKCGLNKFDLIVPYEDLNSAPRLLGEMLGFASVPVLKKINVTGRREAVADVPAALRRRIEDLNRIDAELYEAVTRQFSDRLAGRAAAAFVAPMAVAANDEFGDGAVRIEGLWLGCRSEPTTEIRAGDELTIVLKARAFETVADVTAGIQITDEAGSVVFGTNTHHLRQALSVEAAQVYRIEFRVPLNLGIGWYDLTVALHSGASHAQRCFHWCGNARRFHVGGSVDYPFVGYVKLQPAVRISAFDQLEPQADRGDVVTAADAVYAYRLLLDREPSDPEVAHWVRHGSDGLTRRGLVARFLESEEYANLVRRQKRVESNQVGSG